MQPNQITLEARVQVHHHLFDSINECYANAGSCRVKRIVIDHPSYANLVNSAARVFSVIDREDEHQRRLARNIWLLKSTIAQTLLPFDDARLGIQSLIEKVRVQAETVPSVSGMLNGLCDMASSLVSSGRNPKRDLLLETISKSTLPTGRVGIFAGLQSGPVPGWPTTVAMALDFPIGTCTVLKSRKDIAQGGFSIIVIPSTLKFTSIPIAIDLLYGGRSMEVLLLGYRRENVFVPEPVRLPIDGRFHRATRTLKEVQVIQDVEDQPLDQWANDTFWQEIRNQHAGGGVELSEMDDSVPARFVLFADGSGTFLPDKGSVVELSGLFDSPDQPLAEGDQLPRKSVQDLEERDLVMLRLRGSGDYLDEVADRLMEREGQASLRETATAWKGDLFRALKLHGEGVVARRARQAGLKLRSASYLWTWASDAVIAPHDVETFCALISALGDLQVGVESDSSDEYARAKWVEMERLKNFHQRAAFEIRKALLERVHTLVVARSRVEVVETIQLPGLEAGSIGLLRVSAVDVLSMRVPRSRLFHLVPVKVT